MLVPVLSSILDYLREILWQHKLLQKTANLEPINGIPLTKRPRTTISLQQPPCLEETLEYVHMHKLQETAEKMTQYDSYLLCLTVSGYELFECPLYTAPYIASNLLEGNQKCMSYTLYARSSVIPTAVLSMNKLTWGQSKNDAVICPVWLLSSSIDYKQQMSARSTISCLSANAWQ